jgi:hypothetical protein
MPLRTYKVVHRTDISGNGIYKNSLCRLHNYSKILRWAAAVMASLYSSLAVNSMASIGC